MSHLAAYLQSYLLNSLWQVPLVCAAAWLATRLLRAEDALLHHRIWVAALLAESVLPACQVPDALRSRLALFFVHGSGHEASVAVTLGGGTVLHAGRWMPTLLWLLVSLYGCVLLLLAMRLVWRYLRVMVLQRNARPAALSPPDAAVLARCCERLHVSGVTVAISDRISGPVTVGVVRPLLLLPQWILERVRSADLHTALAHEVAHIHRRDFARNLIYEVVCLPVAYHPCVWLTRASLVESREEVCDGLAAELLSGREEYARSLLRLAAMLLEVPFARKSHAIGIFDAHAFERRIMKLTMRSAVVNNSGRAAKLAGCAAIALLTCGSSLALRVNVTGEPGPAGAHSAVSDRPVPVSPGVMAGNSLHKVMPVYPPEAKTAKIQGAVVLHAIISKVGMVESLQVESGPEELRQSALNAVSQWTYKPFLLNGNPVDVETKITVTYSFSE